MTTPQPSRSPAEIEDIILRKIFLVSLVDSMENDSRVFYLEMSAAEILSEAKDLKLSKDLMVMIVYRSAVSYCRIHLGIPNLFPNHETIKSKVSPLLPLMFSEVGGISSSGGVSPPGLVEDFVRDAVKRGQERRISL